MFGKRIRELEERLERTYVLANRNYEWRWKHIGLHKADDNRLCVLLDHLGLKAVHVQETATDEWRIVAREPEAEACCGTEDEVSDMTLLLEPLTWPNVLSDLPGVIAGLRGAGGSAHVVANVLETAQRIVKDGRTF